MTKTKYLAMINSGWKMGVFLLTKLPGAWFMGVRMRTCDGQRATVELPYGWRSQNPFKSTYFAAQCAAGELSTGVLCMYALQEKPPVSMLVMHIEAEFYKKANQTLTFTCTEGTEIQAAIEQTLATGTAVTLRMTAVGRLPDGTEASKIRITWSFKGKK